MAARVDRDVAAGHGHPRSMTRHKGISGRADLGRLAEDLARAWGCWAPSLTRDARRVAHVSDRRGLPELRGVSRDERFALVRDGARGVQRCRLLARATGTRGEVLPRGSGSTDLGMLRAAPADDPHSLVAYVVTDAGQPRRAVVAVPFGADGQRAG